VHTKGGKEYKGPGFCKDEAGVGGKKTECGVSPTKNTGVIRPEVPPHLGKKKKALQKKTIIVS